MRPLARRVGAFRERLVRPFDGARRVVVRAALVARAPVERGEVFREAAVREDDTREADVFGADVFRVLADAFFCVDGAAMWLRNRWCDSASDGGDLEGPVLG